MARQNQVRTRAPKGSEHHERYPQRMQAHLAAAVDAVEALSAPLPVEGSDPTPAGLASRYGATESLGGSEDE